MKKRCLCSAIAAWACLALPLAAQPQGYPSRPICSIMTVAGGADIVARLVAQGLSGARPKLEDLFPREAFQLRLPLPRMHEIDYKF